MTTPLQSWAAHDARLIAALIGQGRYDLTSEKACQRDIATLLAGEGVGFAREYRLGGRSTVDFLCEGGVAIEVKMLRGQGPGAILRQLERYAASSKVASLILASNKAVDLAGEIGGKPAIFVSLGAAWL